MFIQAFFEGILAAFGSLVLEELSLLALGPAASNSLLFLFIAATIEELLKFIMIFNHRLKIEAKQKILYLAPLVGVGFFATESLLKYWSHETLTIPALAGVFAVHFLTTGIFGYFISRRYAMGLFGNTLLILFNISIHFLYNLAIFHSWLNL